MVRDAAIEAFATSTCHRTPDVVRRFADSPIRPLRLAFFIFAMMHNTTNLHWEIIVTP